MLNEESINFKKIKEIIKKSNQKLTILSTDDDPRFKKAKKKIQKEFPNIKYILIDSKFIKKIQPGNKVELYKLYKKIRGEKEDDESLKRNISNPNYFATLMLANKMADGIVSGVSHPTSDILRPAFQILKSKNKEQPISSFMWLSKKNHKDLFMADVSVIPEPSSEYLAAIAIQTADNVKEIFNINPIIAMLSFSTSGSGGNHPMVKKIQEATAIAKKTDKYQVYGEIQWDAAFDQKIFKFKTKAQDNQKLPNVFIFPDLNCANIGYKIASTTGKYQAIGPIIQNIGMPVNDLSRGATVDEIYNLVLITALQIINKK